MHKDSIWGLRTRRAGLGANDAMGAHLVGTKAHRGKGLDPARRRLFAGRVLKVATQGGLVTCRFRRVTASLPDNGRMQHRAKQCVRVTVFVQVAGVPKEPRTWSARSGPRAVLWGQRGSPWCGRRRLPGSAQLLCVLCRVSARWTVQLRLRQPETSKTNNDRSDATPNIHFTPSPNAA